jgi:hypothetical protein
MKQEGGDCLNQMNSRYTRAVPGELAHGSKDEPNATFVQVTFGKMLCGVFFILQDILDMLQKNGCMDGSLFDLFRILQILFQILREGSMCWYVAV